jgi:signal transduction histidine kinase
MNTRTIRVLLVEDNADDVILFREMFRKEQPGSFELAHRERMSDAVDYLASQPVDIVLLDMGLPDGHGLETVRRAHAAAPKVPLIVLTGLDDEDIAAQALKDGALDYLVKGQIENRALPRALRYAIERHQTQMETEKIRNQQLQLKDEFLSHVSHELRSPLTAIYEFVSILTDGIAGEMNSEQAEYLQVTLRNVLQLRSMIDDLLDVTRVQGGKLSVEPRCISVADVIAEAVTVCQASAAAKEIALSLDVPAGLPRAYADPRRLRQVMINLISNAIKFTPLRGAVTVQAKVYEANPKFLLVQVADTGCGLSPQDTQHVFERLYQVPESQAARKGLGLGLYICKELVSRQGGEIWVNSKLREGSMFSFTVPIFSLDTLIAPVLRHEERRSDPIALFEVRMRPADGWLTDEAREEASLQARNLLQKCLMPALDVLLPQMGPANSDEGVFLVVARANEAGAAVMSKRIREQFARSEQFARTGLAFSVSYSLIKTAPQDVHAPMEEFVGRVASKMQDRINAMFRSNGNEQ